MTHCPLALKYKFTMNLKSTLLLLLCLMMAGMVAAKDNTKVIAHRGYWKTEGSAQNSIRSLERASEIGAYGSESPRPCGGRVAAPRLCLPRHQGSHPQGGGGGMTLP